jgi:hypothetical protein
MKKAPILFLLVSQLNAFSQDSPGESDYKEGIRHLEGIIHKYDPLRARQFFWSAASQQNSKAMLALGSMYSKGLTGTINADSAHYWYNHASTAGATNTSLLTGQMYQFGKGVPVDFAKAARYYKEGISQNSNPCKTAFAYLSYKGLGTAQNYETAFRLFREVAETDQTQQAMYFLGLCYRNGYGTTANAEQANYWLKKAAAIGDDAAFKELNEEPTPENLTVITSSLQQQLKTILDHAEHFKADNNNNYEGVYTGHAVYYDWSGKYVSEILPLKVELKKTGTGYTGTWQEGEKTSSSISMLVDGNRFTFNKNSWYTRNNHYSGRKDEIWQFNDADLQLAFLDDNTQLSGFVRFYSPRRGEPGKPLQIILSKKTVYSPHTITSVSDMKLIPNPATSQCMVQFKLAESAKVTVQVYSQNGSLMHVEQQKLLPAGMYNYPISLSKLAAGVYYVQILIDGQKAETKTLIKQ